MNATGPWVKQFFDDGMHLPSVRHPPDQGQPHCGAARAYQKQAYILQNEDKRIVFVIPWMDEFSIIGTTDVEYKGDPKTLRLKRAKSATC